LEFELQTVQELGYILGDSHVNRVASLGRVQQDAAIGREARAFQTDD
jgi:hypothetical protein